MSFDKEQYWANKKNNVASKRPKPTVTPHTTLGKTRKESRRKVVARIFRGVTDTLGIKHTAKGAIRAIKKQEFHPSQDPLASNHQRLIARRARVSHE
jgi:hypothetical protein